MSKPKTDAKTPVIEPSTQIEGVALLEHCIILRDHRRMLYCNLFIVSIKFGNDTRYHLMLNSGDDRAAPYHEPLRGDVEILGTFPDSRSITIVRDKELNTLTARDYNLWSEYNGVAAGVQVPVLLLNALGLRPYDPTFRLGANQLASVTTVINTLSRTAVSDISAYRNPMYSGVTMVTGQDSGNITLEQQDYSLASAIATRRKLIQLLLDIRAVEANAEGQLEALEHLLADALASEPD